MKFTERTIVYIDGANLHQGIMSLGWDLDYDRFYVWLKDKYGVDKIYIFIGLVSKYKNLYTKLQESGFTLVFKETICGEEGKIKGNCDANLVLKVASDFYENKFDKAIIVSSDGDYADLLDFLNKKGSFRILLSPRNKCSYLLRKQNIPILYLDTQRNKIEKTAQKEKAPDKDGTL
ncbi:MAG: hypothetical protein UT05_C0002G0086 [Parcubacteria group bacterium GW2011_GWF2_38_76]|nr:MAG: hypothetical protein UT05_C0002G0086 [Parcubacteria group bacterium GW2011_GWF2_38_76]HBM45756.1 hypothetical protein [Patescibacteria group bacterium]